MKRKWKIESTENKLIKEDKIEYTQKINPRYKHCTKKNANRKILLKEKRIS